MYIPKHFQKTERDDILAFIRRFSFGTIVSLQEGRPVASHLPFAVSGTDESIILSTHFARANTQWQSIEDQEVLVIFSEPHAYIPPRLYENDLNVPTWNYISVHLYGYARVILDTVDALSLLEKMIETYDNEYRLQWESLPGILN